MIYSLLYKYLLSSNVDDATYVKKLYLIPHHSLLLDRKEEEEEEEEEEGLVHDITFPGFIMFKGSNAFFIDL